MSAIIIRGGRPLSGSLTVQGAKNSVLPILAATLLSGEVCRIRHCPRLRDVETAMEILRHLGCRADWQGRDLLVDAADLTRWDVPDHLMSRMRSSVVFLGAILARCGQAEMTYPGGCELGARPIDLHLAALRSMGAAIQETGGRLACRRERLTGTEIVLSLPSVGATENAMLAACGAEGTTVIANAAREPEIVDLQTFLQKMGAHVQGAGSSTVVVEGGAPLHGCVHTVVADRIVAATYLAAAAGTGGDIRLEGVDYRHLSAVATMLRQAGCRLTCGETSIRLQAPRRLQSAGPIRTAPYPGFPTDAQAVLMASLLRSEGATVFVENIFDSRYRHVPEMVRMGADIRLEGRVAVVCGVDRLHGAAVRAKELRGGASLVLAALQAEGETAVTGVEHIQRGYEDLTWVPTSVRRNDKRRALMARRSRRNRRRRRGRFAFLYRLLCFVLICAAIVGALVLFFKVDTISVSGNDRYSRETILAASGVSEGDNLFLLNKYDAAARITEALPYVESVRLSRKLPGTLCIDIVECSDPAGIQQDGHCWLISPEGKLVDSPAEAPNGCPMVVGLSLTDPQVGSLAAVPEEQSGDLARLLELLRQLRSKGMTAQIGEIRFEESGIVLRYQDRLDVYLDREDDFAYRLRYLAAVLEKLEENETGTIRWDAEGSARFIPG